MDRPARRKKYTTEVVYNAIVVTFAGSGDSAMGDGGLVAIQTLYIAVC